MGSWRAVLAAVVVAFLAAACDPEPEVQVVRHTPTAVEGADETPEAQGQELPVHPPEDVASRLVGGEQPLGALPSDYSVETTELVRESPPMAGFARAVRYTLKGPDRTNVVTYYIYPGAAEARTGMGDVLRQAVRADMISLGYPARQLDELSPDGQIGSTRILVLMGQTVVESVSTLGVTSPGGNQAHAIETARAAITYLESVTK